MSRITIDTLLEDIARIEQAIKDFEDSQEAQDNE